MEREELGELLEELHRRHMEELTTIHRKILAIIEAEPPTLDDARPVKVVPSELGEGIVLWRKGMRSPLYLSSGEAELITRQLQTLGYGRNRVTADDVRRFLKDKLEEEDEDDA